MSAASSSNSEDLHMFEPVEDMKTKYAESIAALRAKLILPCPDDVICYRFLRGHKFNLDVAAEHLNTTLQWRKDNNLDELRKKAEKITQKQYPFAEKVLAVHPHNIIHGQDKSGQPLSVERLGYANPYLMTRTMKFDDMKQYHFYHMEAKASIVAELTAKSGKVIRTCKIMDLSGLGRHHLDRRGLVFFKKLIEMSQNNYPEMLGKLYVVNTPWIFSLGWKIVKPWLNPATLNKIHILDNNEKMIEVLKADIDEQYIPDWLGGTCKCEQNGGCVPLVDPDAAMTTQQISARGKFETKITVDQAQLDKLRASLASSSSSSASPSSPNSTFKGASVAYEFRTKKNDLAFEVRSQPIDAKGNVIGSETVLHPMKRYETDQDIVCGAYVVDTPTVLTFIFDNSFSYFTGKTLLYRLDVDAATAGDNDADEAGVDDALSHADEPDASPK